MIELISNEIKSEAIVTEFSYDIRFWNLGDENLINFLKINYDEFFKDYTLEIFRQQMKSYFELISILAIENNKNVDDTFIVESLYLIPYNTIRKYEKSPESFDYSIIKNKYLETLGEKALTKK